MQNDTSAEFSGAGFSTPQQEHSGSEMLTPSSVNESGAMRFRNLDDIYDDTSEVELVDSDVEALLVKLMNQPVMQKLLLIKNGRIP